MAVAGIGVVVVTRNRREDVLGVLGRRRALPEKVERGLTALEGQQRRSRARRYLS